MFFRWRSGVICAFSLFLAITGAWGEKVEAASTAPPTCDQVVEQMIARSKWRAEELKQYHAVRHYQVEYRGFAAAIAARMEVEANFDAATGKSFHIVSQSGSKFLAEKVLKRAVDSEKEAQQDKAATALTPANYRFHLAGSESVDGRPAFVLDVEPLTDSKFLYRGRIWVDAVDFAVTKMETEPARSPSFLISRTHIHSTSIKTHGFWLPQEVRSETKVRFGGTAVLTIDYGTYSIMSSAPPSGAGN
jgi:hypothetical protein